MPEKVLPLPGPFLFQDLFLHQITVLVESCRLHGLQPFPGIFEALEVAPVNPSVDADSSNASLVPEEYDKITHNQRIFKKL